MTSSKLRTVGLVVVVALAPALFLLVVLGGGGQDDGPTTSSDSGASVAEAAVHSSTDEGSTRSVAAQPDTASTGSTVPYTGEPSPVTAEFTASAIEGLAPLDVDFIARASTSSGGQIQSYEWIFGDGFEAPGDTATHIYQASGSYEARLLVTDSEGFESATRIQIVVSAGSESASELVDYSIDPGFETSQNGFENAYDESSSELITDRPIEGQASLAVSLPAWSDILLPVHYPWMAGPFANSVIAEASIRVDERAPDTMLQLCAVAYWVANEEEVREENCVEIDGQEGKVEDVSVQLDFDPEIRLGRIYFWLSSIGNGEANLSIDDAHLVLDKIPE